MINYYNGDVFDLLTQRIEENRQYNMTDAGLIERRHIVFPHVVNNQNAFGAGLAYGFKMKYPDVKQAYHDYYKNWTDGAFKSPKEKLLGQVHYVHVDGFTVANMFAQELGGERPLFYDKLVHCMEDVLDYCIDRKENDCLTEIITVKFGSGLAGGKWDFIEELIKDIWVKQNLKVTVCVPTF